jgi:hypothetical protein
MNLVLRSRFIQDYCQAQNPRDIYMEQLLADGVMMPLL